MPSASGIRAGRAFVELFADDSKLVRGLKAASTKLKAWGASIGSLGKTLMTAGMAALGPMLAAVKHFMEFGDTISKASIRTGVAVGALSELGYAAELSGADLDELEKGLRKMQRTLAKADEESKSAVGALGKLGIQVEDLQGLNPEEQFTALADRIGRIADPAKRTAAAMEIFGRTGSRLIPLMAGGAAGIGLLRNEARELGLTMSEGDARAAVALKDALHGLWRVIKAGAFAIGSALGPTLLGMARRFTDLAVRVNKWIRANPELFRQIARLAAIVAGAGAALFVFAQVFPAVAGAIGLVIAALGVMSTVLTWVATPWGAIIALVAAAGGAVAGLVLPWGQMFDFLKGKLLGLWELVGRVIGGIFDAFVGARFDLMWPILTAGASLAWLKILRAAKETWNGIAGFVTDTIVGIAGGLANLFWQGWYGVRRGFAWLMAELGKMWNTTVFGMGALMIEKIGQAFAGVLGSMAQGLQGTTLFGAVGDAMADAAANVGALAQQSAQGLRQEATRKNREIGGLETLVTPEGKEVRAPYGGLAKTWGDIKKDEERTLADLAQAVDVTKQALRNRLGFGIDLTEEQAAQEELDRLLDEARRAAAAREGFGAPGRPPGEEPGLDLTGKSSVAGTFAGLAVGRMGTPDRMEKMLAHQREQLANDRRALLLLDEGNQQAERIERAILNGLAFA